jgi:hypothetical protein
MKQQEKILATYLGCDGEPWWDRKSKTRHLCSWAPILPNSFPVDLSP